jgi:hypothetical protein
MPFVPPGFRNARLKVRWIQWRLHRQHRPRRQWAAHVFSAEEVVTGLAWRNPDLSDEWRPNPGAYLICRNDRVLYVGFTARSLEHRVRTHHCLSLLGARLTNRFKITIPGSPRARRLMLRTTDTVAFYCCADRWLAELLECLLVHVFSPRFNKQRPDVAQLSRHSRLCSHKSTIPLDRGDANVIGAGHRSQNDHELPGTRPANGDG